MDLRRQASRRREGLAKRLGYKCHYCQCDVYTRKRLESLGYSNIRILNNRIYGTLDREVEFLYATIEHLIPLSQGGTNDTITIACTHCNTDKNKDTNWEEAKERLVSQQYRCQCGVKIYTKELLRHNGYINLAVSEDRKYIYAEKNGFLRFLYGGLIHEKYWCKECRVKMCEGQNETGSCQRMDTRTEVRELQTN